MAHLNSREEVAMKLLQEPEEFKSLSKRILGERQVLFWRFPSFYPHSSWSLFKSYREKCYYLRRLEHDPHRGFPSNVQDPHIFGCEVVVEDSIAMNVLNDLENLKVPIFRLPSCVGADGTFFGIKVGHLWQGTEVNWWSTCTPDWQPMLAFFDQTVELFDNLLPASTLRDYQP